MKRKQKYEGLADSVEDFCYKYYLPSFFNNMDEKYKKTLLANHEEEFKQKGFTVILGCASISSKRIYYYGNKEK